MWINKLLKMTSKIALLSVACGITTSAYAQTSYYQGTVTLNSPVSVDMGVLDGLGAPATLPELLSPSMFLPPKKLNTPPKPMAVAPMQLDNAAMPTSSLEGAAPLAAAKVAPAPTPMKVEAPAPAPSIAPASGIIGSTSSVATPAKQVSDAAKEEIKNIEAVTPKAPTPTITEVAKTAPASKTPAENEAIAIATAPAQEEIQKIAAIPATTKEEAPAPVIEAPAVVEVPVVKAPVVEETPKAEIKVASIDPNAVKVNDGGGLSINFSEGSSDLPTGVNGALDELAAKLNADENLRVQLWGYAEIKDDSPSQARRLSLFRALSVRTYLMKQGVRSTRMDVRALGDKVESGPSDRVDVVFPK